MADQSGEPLSKTPDFKIGRCPWPAKVLAQREITAAFSIGVGPGADEHFALRDGRFFRIAQDHEEPHAVLPRASAAHPGGIPLRAVRIEDLSDLEYQLVVEKLPAPPKAVAEYSVPAPMGAGGHQRTDEGPGSWKGE